MSWGTIKLIDGEDMSADITSAYAMGNSRNALLHIVSAAATHAGVIYLQESGDRVNWHNVPLVNKSTAAVSTSITVSSGSAVDDTVEIETNAEHIRVFWDRTSGIGTLNAWLAVKE